MKQFKRTRKRKTYGHVMRFSKERRLELRDNLARLKRREIDSLDPQDVKDLRRLRRSSQWS